MSKNPSFTLRMFFFTMLRVGATGFGGPMALISMVQQHLVERHRAVSNAEFSEGVAIGQVLPGPIAVDAVIHVGYRLFSWAGAALGTLGLLLPPYLLMLVLTPLYFHYGRVPEAQGFFAGVRPAVVAAIAAASLRLGKRGIKDRRGYAIAAIVFLWMLLRDQMKPFVVGLPKGSATHQVYQWSGAIFLVLISGILGMVFYRDATGEDGAKASRETGSDG